jgi:hypothetical protein
VKTPEVIRDAARLVCAAETLNVTRAVCWAVHGCECLPRDMTAAEALYVAEVLDDLESVLGPVSEYERAHADDPLEYVATAMEYVADILPGGTAWVRDIWEK